MKGTEAENLGLHSTAHMAAASKEVGKGHLVMKNPDADPIGPHWPRQSLFVGQNHCVEWNGGGGKFASNQSTINEADVDVALGKLLLILPRTISLIIIKNLGQIIHRF